MSERTSILKWFKSTFLPHRVKYVTHQDSDWRHFILLSPKYIPPQLAGILDFNWNHYFISVNFQYSNTSCVLYPSSTRTLIWAVVDPRVPWSDPINKLFGMGVETCTAFQLACQSPAPCTTVENCGALVGWFWYASGDSESDADTTCKVKIRKKSYFAVSHFASP